jgi:hypothetical protein
MLLDMLSHFIHGDRQQKKRNDKICVGIVRKEDFNQADVAASDL